MKKVFLIAVATVLVVGGFLFLIFWWRGSQNEKVEDNQEVATEQEKTSEESSEVQEQEKLIEKATQLFNEAKAEGVDFSDGPCLGMIEDDWVLDIAHNPREEVDNQPENQCPEFRSGQAHHFIELDPQGKVIEIY